MIIEGYASLFGIEDSGGDTMQYGAIRVPESWDVIPMLHNHETSLPIGVWDSWSFDMTGFKVRGKIVSDTREGLEVQALIRSGAIRGLSIGYNSLRHTRDRGKRQLHEIDLVEVSVTAVPLLKQATITKCETKLLSFASLRARLGV